ncbi:site-specific DNA-methyltransferase, partial [Anaerolineae bacterium CFX7]|nr:site-specific DNA-methyltransferase [Anaerolineae bacterium CFX7]
MPRKKDYSAWSKQDLIQRIHALEKRKKYGLVWDEEHTPEEFEKEARDALPVLQAVPSKAIHSSPDDPTHILIEGDNFHALSALNYTHEKAVDVIYIDPPYNTGNQDFRYNDKFVEKEDAYRHSKWLSFMDKRLRLAKNLLKDTGVIFISIDDNEMAQLKILCDEIFGSTPLGIFIWKARSGKGGTADQVASLHEYILCYARDKRVARLKPDTRIGSRTKERLRQWGQGDSKKDRETMYFGIPAPDGTLAYPIKDDGTEGRWRVGQKEANRLLEANELEFEFSEGKWKVYRIFSEDNITETATDSLLLNVGTATDGTKEILKIFGKKVFDTAKPTSLILHLLDLMLYDMRSGIVLDFFAGSGATGDAVLQLNKNQKRFQFILATNNEKNICTEVCYPRLKQVIQGYDFEGTERKVLFEEKLSLTKMRKAAEIYTEYEEARDANETEFDSLKGEFRENILRLWGIDYIDDHIEGLGGNLNYYRTAFVPAAPTDANKETLTLRSVEMLCLRENTFEFVRENAVWKIFKNQARYTAILFDNLAIPKFKKELA